MLTHTPSDSLPSPEDRKPIVAIKGLAGGQEAVPEDDRPDSGEEIQAIIQLVQKSIGVDFSQYKLTTIRRRIIRRMLLYKLDTLADYTRYIQDNATEARILYNDLLINVTTFFRDTEAMSYIGEVLLPQLTRSMSTSNPVRIWVPACSTGQEAYSLAILLLEALGEETTHPPIQIFATDLSEPAIAKARLGTYSKSEVLDVSPERLQRFFTKVDDQYCIHKTIRDLCVFAPHNLFKDPPFSRLDLISCRNLLIYLNSGLQQKAFATFHYALKPSGFLLLGKSETVSASASLFTAIEKNYRVYGRRNEDDTLAPGHLSVDRNDNLMRASRGQSERMDDMDKQGFSSNTAGNDLNKLVDNLLLAQYVPASVVVNQELEILQFRGSTGLFLESAPGQASLNLIKMARPPLVFELRNAVHKAHKSGQTVRKGGITINVNDGSYQVVIEVVPLPNEGGTQLFLVLFTEEPATIASEDDTETRHNARVRQLEEELTMLREDMHSIIEEKQASDNELRLTNVANNALRSTNEELLAINLELQLRNDQLTETHGHSTR